MKRLPLRFIVSTLLIIGVVLVGSSLFKSKSYTSSMNTYTIEVTGGVPVIVADISIESTPMGHKISSDGRGEAAFAKLRVTHGEKIVEEYVYQGDSFNVDYFNIKAVKVADDGNSMTLEVKDTRLSTDTLTSDNPSTLSLKSGETSTVFDLTVKNRAGGHDIKEDGNDESWVSLELSTPRKPKILHIAYADTEGARALTFDTYTVQVTKVGFDADVVNIIVRKI